MRAALIPPYGFFDYARKSDIHLVLAQVTNPTYQRIYSLVPDEDYIIVDNGAAEGQPVTDDELLRAAANYGANEIVVPDVMQNGYETAERALRFFRDNDFSTWQQGTRFMLVGQGTTLTEVARCFDRLIAIASTCNVAYTLGVPRHLLTTLDDRFARHKILGLIASDYGDRNVHLLGTNSIFPNEIRRIAEDFPWVRSVDSSMPFNYTIAERRLSDLEPGINRPKGYFEDQIYIDQFSLLDENIATYLGWASGTEGTGS